MLTALRIENRRPDAHGHQVIATFSYRIGGVELLVCALVRTRNNGFTTWPPAIGKGDDRRGVRIIDSKLFNEITSAARTAYRSMGGTEAEWKTSAPADDDTGNIARGVSAAGGTDNANFIN
jgi:hypothetical protein